jgi:hypothetical protein
MEIINQGGVYAHTGRKRTLLYYRRARALRCEWDLILAGGTPTETAWKKL